MNVLVLISVLVTAERGKANARMSVVIYGKGVYDYFEPSTWVRVLPVYVGETYPFDIVGNVIDVSGVLRGG
ncbi:hypothetical protein DGG96_08430 [Legionella qingyii]|uniref:Uncharacterized protein n=1 Tax=Legionella qingyii TaxID=2184757 RepID=A0A317U443_9GAMM|nr:hypothetical protein DGG96_08430 [Legionella qingyii]